MTPAKDLTQFILDNTALLSPPHVPEMRLHLADEAHQLWHRTEEELGELGLEPPFWAFAWAGGQGLARYVLDHPETVAKKRIHDFATGSGLVAIAAAMAGAGQVTAHDIDPFCQAALLLNARANDVSVTFDSTRGIGSDLEDFDLVLAGDVFFDRHLARNVEPWFRKLAEGGKTVLVGDPGRHYLPVARLELLAEHQVPVTRILEDSEIKSTKIWRFRA